MAGIKLHMNTFISMLRGVNVSDQKKIQMAELKNLYESTNVLNVETYDVVFDSDERDAFKLAELLEERVEKSLGYRVPVIIRDSHGFKRIIDNNPFLKERNEDPASSVPIDSEVEISTVLDREVNFS